MEPALSATRLRPAAENRRDPALDMLRTVALARVLLWHAFAASWMTFFAAMPVMFFVAGTLLEAPTAAGSHRALVRRRARRLLLPLWVYGAVVAVAGVLRDPPGGHTLASAPSALGHAATWILPLVDPAGSEWHGGWLSTHLWYLRTYLWILLLVPLLAVLARRAARTLPILLLAVAALDLCHRAHVPVVGSGTTGVLLGDALTYGGFVVLGMAYRRRGGLPVRLLAAGAAGACAATIAYVALAGLPAGGVNDSYGAVALTGVAWLLAAGAAEGPIRRLAERPSTRRLTAAVTRRAVTIYLWHPAAIALAYAVLKGSDRFPRMSMVHQWPVPAVLVVALTVASTAIAVAALGWVEDLAARRSPTARAGRERRAPRVGARAARLAAMVPSAATALAFMVPSLVVPVADGDPAGAASIFGAPRPPSYRAALGNDAFARRAPAGDLAALGRVDPAKARLGETLERWLAGQADVDAVSVGVAVHGRIWTGAADKDGSATRPGPNDELRALSMTKTFTTALVLQQVKAGRLSLDRPVPRLPELHVTGEAATITVHQLLDHTSGLIEYSSAPGFDASRPLDAREAVQLALSAPLQSSPGAEVHYSNTNFLYLGVLLEHAAGRPYADLVTDLFHTHGIRSSRLDPGGPGWPGFSSGGVVSTVGDLARWGDALFTPGRVLPAADVRRLTTLDDHNMALSMWPLCPCGTDPDGVKQYAAIGQTVGYGALMRFPSGTTLVVRFEPVPAPMDAAIVNLGRELERALRAATSAGRP